MDHQRNRSLKPGNKRTDVRGESRLPVPGPGTLRVLPAGIWAMGLGSMFMDISSELIHSLLPVFMATTLGASMATIGVIEGAAEGTAAITKILSGSLSDYLRRRKSLMVLGYAVAALTKPVFPLANSIGWVFGARFADRVGKGIRGAPRDALISEIAPVEVRGAAYGLRQALDSLGAVLGPLLAVFFMALMANDIRGVMWVAVLPAAIAVALLVLFVHEPARGATPGPARSRFEPASVRRLPRAYWLVLLLGSVFTLARFSEAFLVLRAQDVGLGVGNVPLVLIVMNVFYASIAYPAGAAADRLNERTLLFIGLVLLMAADVFLALAAAPLMVFAGAASWGLHMAATQGLFAKLVADTSPPDLRGTAFGVFNLVTGLALLLASVIAGVLWSSLGASATFIAGGLFGAIALLVLWFVPIGSRA